MARCAPKQWRLRELRATEPRWRLAAVTKKHPPDSPSRPPDDKIRTPDQDTLRQHFRLNFRPEPLVERPNEFCSERLGLSKVRTLVTAELRFVPNGNGAVAAFVKQQRTLQGNTFGTATFKMSIHVPS